MDFSKVGVVRLSNKNYRSWAFKVQMLMMREGTWKYVDPGVAPAPVTPDWTEGDMKARATIALLTEDSQHNLIMAKATAKETWDALKAHHHKATLTGKVALLKEICSANYREGESMEVFLYEMEDLYSRLENAGERLSANMQVAMVLRSLPKSFDALTTALESRSDKELTMDLVRAKLIDESEKLYGEKVQEERVLKAKGDAKPICFFCGQSGHKKRECKKFLSRKNSRDSEDKIETRNRPKKDERVKKVRENDARSFTFMIRQPDTRGASCSWLLDSGASSHMCSDISGFTVIEKSLRSNVTVADGSENRVEGVGDCLIRCATENGESIELTLRGVLYVPTLEGNMISIGKLAEKGVRAVFDNTGCKLVYENTVVAIADKASDMYWLRVAQEQVMKSVVKEHTKNCQHTWHRRLGHRDPAILGEMKRRDLVSGLNVVNCGIRWTCECCIECKMARPPFPSVAEKTSKEVLDIIHSDVCGPMEVTTLGGCRYYMTLIDDYSRYTFVYFLKHKSEVESKIREYVKLVQNQFGRKPRIIRSDQGGEYSSKELRKFYVNEGIKVEYTTAYSPQQNGVSERKNRSLSEMGRCMLRDAGMHKKYWAEAINTACYLQNRLPSAAVKSTPFEMWFGRKPEVKHLRLFGCSGYMMIPAAKRSKLDVKAVKMTFVGYSAEHKAYRMLDMSTGQIHISRDVRFIELGDGSKEKLPEQKLGENSEIEWTFNERKSQDEECDANSENDFFDCDEDGGLTRLPRVDNEGDPTSNSGTEIRRSHRKTAGVPPARYAGKVNLAAQIVDEPRTYTEAISGPQSAEWKSAIAEEMQSHRDNSTWELVELPPHRKAIGSKWIFKRKADEDGNIVRYKARLVAQGFTQKFGTDYDLVFAPVVKQITFRTMLVLASRRKMLTKHVDIKTAYLHGVLTEEIFMRQPPGYESGRPNEVCLLRRSIYGLKQAARVWNTKIDDVLKTMGFIQSTADPCLYTRKKANQFLFVLVYVDDVIVICNTEEEFAEVIHVLKLNFTISVMGNLRFFLGIRIRLDDGLYCIDQQAYLERVLERFGMLDAKPSKYPMDPGFLKRKEEIDTRLDSPIAYQSLIGALLYAAVTSRPDISIATAILGRRVQHPSETDWNEARRVLRYLKGTLNHVLYLGGSDQKLECFVDADWAGDESDRKSNSGFVFKFGGGLIGWGCHKQKCVALSSTEAEYVSLAECLQEVKWILKLMADVGEQLVGPVLVHEDNQSCIALTKGDRAERKAKHIDTKFNFVKDMVRDGIVQLQYCATENMQADLLTKPLQAVKLRQHREAIGIKPFSVEEEC
uniref:Uncharacterized protein n=1 Tax=Anopheles atroparvus TaxID=41427 RepID=A0AAG5DHX2_ANOAO